MSALISPVKSIKISIAIAAADFDLTRVPPKGTPGAKAQAVDYEFQAPGGVSLSASIKVPALQKVLEGIAAGGGGGFVVINGRLGVGRLEEPGLAYQPPKPAA